MSGYGDPGSLDQRVQGWLRTVRGVTRPRPHLRIDPPRCALLVIDMLRYFADPAGRCFLPEARAITPRLVALIEAWREADAPIIFTRHGHQGPQDLGMLGRFFSDYIRADEPEGELIAPLRPRDGEPVLPKTTYDAFWQTPLAEILAERGATQVLVTGVLTHMCCETTARTAFCRGYEVYLAADATASSSAERHLGALLGMADSVAVVMSCAEILERCRRARRQHQGA